LARCNEEVVQLFAGVARRLWLHRNEVVHGSHPTLLVRQARIAVEEFKKVHEQAELPNDPQSRLVQEGSWKAPQSRWVKAKWDASLAVKKGWARLGVVVRDDSGRVLVAQSQTVSGYFMASLAEARAALMAVQICKELGFKQILFEGDAKLMVSVINSLEPDWSNVGVIIADVSTTMTDELCSQGR
jgi:ribonuclease HI